MRIVRAGEYRARRGGFRFSNRVLTSRARYKNNIKGGKLWIWGGSVSKLFAYPVATIFAVSVLRFSGWD
jgi:hypothetical protein